MLLFIYIIFLILTFPFYDQFKIDFMVQFYNKIYLKDMSLLLIIFLIILKYDWFIPIIY